MDRDVAPGTEERLHDMLLHRNSLITGDHTKWGRGAAIQLRDINTAMAATISLLIDRRHEQSRQKRSSERAALMGREPPDIINLHVEEDAVWTLYKRNKERRRSKHLRHEGKEALERATDINVALDDSSVASATEAQLSPV